MKLTQDDQHAFTFHADGTNDIQLHLTTQPRDFPREVEIMGEIVRAVNAFPELLDALEKTTEFTELLIEILVIKENVNLDKYPQLTKFAESKKYAHDAQLDKSRAAIAAAKGTP